MIAGITCSTKMLEALLSLPRRSYRRVEAALEFAMTFPEEVEEHQLLRSEAIELHSFVARGVLFVIGDSGSQLRLLQVTLFRSDDEPYTVH